MAKRFREDDHPAKVVTEDRVAKRHAPGIPENLQHALPLGWDLLAAAKQSTTTLPLGFPFGEPLRPANQAGQAAAAEGGAHTAAQSQQQQLQQTVQEGAQTAERQQQQQVAAAEAQAAVAALQCNVNIDWHDPEQVARLLRMLHLERLRRQGLELPSEYRQHHPQQQQ